MKTKDKIKAAALSLFNTEGIEKITTRHIAKALEISQGNLHYHFPNKDEVIHVLFKDFLDSIELASRQKSTIHFTKKEVLNSMIDNYKIMYDYRFLFKDNQVVWRRIPSIKVATINLFEQKKKEIHQLIQSYKRANIFRHEISQQQVDYLSTQFIFSITSWLTASEYINHNSNLAEYYARYTFRIWLPYLIDKEMQEWEVILN